MQKQLLIKGELVNGEGEKQPVYNPATGAVLLEIAEASAAQVDAAVQAADEAFDTGANHTKDPCRVFTCWRMPSRRMRMSLRVSNRLTAGSRCTARAGMRSRRWWMCSASLPVRRAA